jgi:hypothetical protein
MKRRFQPLSNAVNLKNSSRSSFTKLNPNGLLLWTWKRLLLKPLRKRRNRPKLNKQPVSKTNLNLIKKVFMLWEILSDYNSMPERDSTLLSNWPSNLKKCQNKSSTISPNMRSSLMLILFKPLITWRSFSGLRLWLVLSELKQFIRKLLV